jgi:RHS repeat-associated protein
MKAILRFHRVREDRVRRALVLLFFLLASAAVGGSRCWGQTITITTKVVYFPYQTQVCWTTNGTFNGWGAAAVNVLLDGGQVSAGYGGTGPSGCSTLYWNQFWVDWSCEHSLTLDAYLWTGWIGQTEVKSTNAIPIWIFHPSTGPRTIAECAGGQNDCSAASPENTVDLSTGKMHYQSLDLQIPGPLPIEFIRRYDSQSTHDGPLGYGWQHSYEVRLEDGTYGTVKVLTDKQMHKAFFPIDFAQGGYLENPYDNLALAGTGTSNPPHRITDVHQTKHDFDSSGTLTGIEDRNGNTITCGYTDGKLTSITDSFGRAVTLAYDGNNHLHTVSAGSRTVTYTYTGNNLTRVDYPDSSYITYEYDGAHNLTAVKDSEEQVIKEYGYDSDKVSATESQDGKDAFTFVYDSSAHTATATNALAKDTVYSFDPWKGATTLVSGAGCQQCGAGGTTVGFAYDDFLNRTLITDGRSVKTRMTYDTKGNVLTRTEDYDPANPPGSNARTWTYTYDSTFNYPTTITIPSVGTCSNANKVVTNTYDGTTGDKLTEQVTGCNGSTPFTYTTTWTYDTSGHGQVKTVDGPRTDVSDVTTHDYYSDSDEDVNRRGRLQRVTNALSQQTNYAGYDAFGNVGSVTDPNNVETDYTYDGRDRLTETRIKDPAEQETDIVTQNEYDSVGNLYRVRRPNCVEAGAGCAYSLQYSYYDGVNWLKEIDDSMGNKIVYSYDAMGNRTREEYRDADDNVRRFTNFGYDDYNRLQYTYFTETEPEATGSIYYKYTYYDDGTRESEQDPMGHVTNFEYDALKRLTTVTQTVGTETLTTTYEYDGQDNLASVTDPNGYQTTYTNNDMGWRLSTVSSDTGTTTYQHDNAGNLTSTTNSNDVTIARTYDALNRVTSVTYPNTSLNVTTTYDSTSVPFGVGRRTGMTDPSGSSTYSYDRRGLLESEQKTIGIDTYTTQYGYDKTGNLTQLLYPTTNAVERQGEADFEYNSADRVSLVTTKVNGTTTTVASDFAYEPFGPRTELTFGNELPDVRTYGSRYQLGTWNLGPSPHYLLSYTHTFDDDLNLTSRTDNLDSYYDHTFGYDEIHRLNFASGPWGAGTGCTGSLTYTYDKNGNRLCAGEGLSTTTYTYESGTNRLASTYDGFDTVNFTYDDNGNTTGDGSHTYAYSDADRLASVDSGATATYTYDGDGRRTSKTVFGTTTRYYFYDPAGRLLTETSGIPGHGEDYVYLEGAPIARVDWTIDEVGLGDVLRVDESSSYQRLDWSSYPSGPNIYIVRRKQVVDPNDRSFNGSTVIATLADPTRTYDDPVVGDGNRYDYQVYRTAADRLYFFHTDHLGTPIAMSDSDGYLHWRGEYLPFGETWLEPERPERAARSRSWPPNNLRFPGQYYDGETGQHQNWFRDYAPSRGRYLEADPIGVGGSPNLYLYVSSNPIGLVDPLGLYECDAKLPGSPTKELALTCFAEASNNCLEGGNEKRAICDTVYNRAAANRSYWGGGSVLGVLQQKDKNGFYMYQGYQSAQYRKAANPCSLGQGDCEKLKGCVTAATLSAGGQIYDFTSFNQAPISRHTRICVHYFFKE